MYITAQTILSAVALTSADYANSRRSVCYLPLVSVVGILDFMVDNPTFLLYNNL